ncbi:hypothetical protein DFS34DRAFT_597294 [Phlyctochytrium arcticum]|nr:hypothetical protein DFS34DRAFT_597294 [Phlyctochytrium arcticum]
MTAARTMERLQHLHDLVIHFAWIAFTDLYPDQDIIICEKNLTLEPWPAVDAIKAIEDILSITGLLEDDEDRREGKVDITPDQRSQMNAAHLKDDIEKMVFFGLLQEDIVPVKKACEPSLRVSATWKVPAGTPIGPIPSILLSMLFK